MRKHARAVRERGAHAGRHACRPRGLTDDDDDDARRAQKRGVTHVYVTGLALDVCVAFTALHAAEAGFVTHVIEDACAGVTLDGIAAQKETMRRAGIELITSSEVPAVLGAANVDAAILAATRKLGASSLAEASKTSAGHGVPKE